MLLTGGLVRLEFARPLPHDVTVQVSDFDALPERYRTLGAAPAGAVKHDLASNGVKAGSRIRVRWISASVPMWGPDLPLVDPQKVLQRVHPSRRSNTNSDADPLDLFHDPQLAHAWSAKMIELVTAAPKTIRAAATTAMVWPSNALTRRPPTVTVVVHIHTEMTASRDAGSNRWNRRRNTEASGVRRTLAEPQRGSRGGVLVGQPGRDRHERRRPGQSGRHRRSNQRNQVVAASTPSPRVAQPGQHRHQG